MKGPTAPGAAGVSAVTLAAFQFLRMDKARGCHIVCTSGILLVTVCGEHRDFELHAGDSLVIPNDGLALIEAIGDSRLLLQGRRRSAMLRRFLPLRLCSGLAQQRSGTDFFSINWF